VIKPRTPNQAQYIANILDHDITFGLQGIDRRGDRKIGFTSTRRADAKGNVVVEDIGDVLRLVW
jgi:phosphate starvation-inducible protein PhoH